MAVIVCQTEWLFLPVEMNTDGTPAGNNGLDQAPVCKQCKPNHLVALRGGGTNSTTGETKVGGNGNFVLIHKVCFAG